MIIKSESVGVDTLTAPNSINVLDDPVVCLNDL